MLKLIGYWSAPADPADIPKFEDAYLNRHCPKAAKIPGLRKLVTTKVDDGLEGGSTTNYRVAELLFDDLSALQEAEKTPEFQAMRQDGGALCEEFNVTVAGETGEEFVHELGG